MQFVVPYAKNRGRCQMMLGRTLRAADNLMQLCIHGGSIKYGDFQEAANATLASMHHQIADLKDRGVIVAKTGSCNHIVCECGEHLCQCCHRRLADMLPHG